MLEGAKVFAPAQIRQASISLTRVQGRFLTKDKETLRLYKRAQTLIDSHKETIVDKFDFLDNIIMSSKLFSNKDINDTRAIIFVAYEVYTKGDII